MHPWNTVVLATLTLALGLILGLAHGLAAGSTAYAQAPVADRAAAPQAPATQAAPRTVREKRADGVTVSIPHDLARTAPGGQQMGYADTSPGAGGGVEPAAMALGYVSPSAGARATMPGPNAAAGPNARTGAVNPLPYQAFSSSAPDAAVNSAPTPAEVGRPELLRGRVYTGCGMNRNFVGC